MDDVGRKITPNYRVEILRLEDGRRLEEERYACAKAGVERAT